jgi:hypothetical protein
VPQEQLTGSGKGSMVGFYVHDNEASGSIKGEESLDKLSNYWLLKYCLI